MNRYVLLGLIFIVIVLVTLVVNPTVISWRGAFAGYFLSDSVGHMRTLWKPRPKLPNARVTGGRS